VSEKIKYVDKNLLDKINHVSDKLMHYNRTIPQEIIDALPADKFFVVIPLLVHEHIAGKRADPHMRCRIYTGPDEEERRGQMLLLDIEMGMYELIPTFHHTPETNPANDNNTPAVVS
jgi:hypothetical protein